MGRKLGKADRLSRVSIATQQVSTTNLSGTVSAAINRQNAVTAEHGRSFDGSNQIIRDDLYDKVEILVALFGLTFTRNPVTERLELGVESYTTHTHEYTDTQIEDTEDGSGGLTTITQNTGEVV